MDLREYLFVHRMKQTDFARKSGLSVGTVQRVINGFPVSIPNAKLVELYTFGEVKAWQMLTPQNREKLEKLQQEARRYHANLHKVKQIKEKKK